MPEKAGGIHGQRDLMRPVRICCPLRFSRHLPVTPDGLDTPARESADGVIKNRRRRQGVMEGDHIPLRKPHLRKIKRRPQQRGLEPPPDLLRRQGHLLGHIQPDGAE